MIADGTVRAGAAGFLLRDTAPEQMHEAVRVVAGGEAMLSPGQAAAASSRSLDADRLAGLTERELQVLAEVGAGCSNAEIAERLFISPATARTHVGRLLSKLDAQGRSQLVVLACETRLITPGRSRGGDE
ncbi:response regulator transcription factor [Saccharopolyspora sp. NPDC003752]